MNQFPKFLEHVFTQSENYIKENKDNYKPLPIKVLFREIHGWVNNNGYVVTFVNIMTDELYQYTDTDSELSLKKVEKSAL